jgi:hypothetical protein
MVKDMTVLTEEQLRDMPFIFQRCMEDHPRVQPAELGRKAGISRHTAKKYLDLYRKSEVLHPPQVRAKICKQIAEYIYLLKVNDVESFIPVLEADKNVLYHCSCAGHFNLIFMSYRPIDLSHLKGFEKTVSSGIRSNYYVPKIVNQSYETAYQKVLGRCDRKIEPSMFDMKLGNFNWTEELWELYCDLKYDLRVDFTSLVKKHGFKTSTFYNRFNLLLTYCDMYVPLYPKREPNYTFFYFLIKTRHQRFIAESFGELPVFSSHIRVKDYLLSNVPVLHGEERDFFRNTFSVWQRRGIIDSYDYSIAYWSEGITHPGMPCPPPLPPPSGTTPPDKGEGNTGKEYMSFM